MNSTDKKRLAEQRRLSKQAEVERAKAIFGDVEIGKYNLPVNHLSKRGRVVLYVIGTPLTIFFIYAFCTLVARSR